MAAPVDLEPKWPEGYVAVLREAGAKEVTIPFCVSWVRGFFARFPERRRRDLGRSEIETHLSETAARPGVSNWMVQQARDAVELYYAKFRGIPIAPRPSVVVRHPPPPVRLPLPPAPAPAPAPRPPAAISPTPTRYANAVREVKEECSESERTWGERTWGRKGMGT